ncbi:MAG: MtaA/CmuA family methyltransferase [Bacillota bacterium]
MSRLTPKERFMNKLMGREVDRAPVFCADQTGIYEEMDELQVFWPEAHQRAGDMARLAAAAYTIAGFDAVRVPFCQTIEAEALGCVIKYAGREGIPSVNVHPYKLEDTVKPLPENYLESGRIPELLEAVKILKQEVGDQVIAMGGIIGPYSIAASLIGITTILKASFKKPDQVKPYLDLAEQAGTALGKALIEAGADIICIEDMMASMDMISPAIYRELVFPWEKRQIEALSVPSILHICGKTNPIIEDMASTGAAILSVEHTIDSVDAKEKLKKFDRFIPLIGGVDAVVTLFSGSEDEVLQQSLKALESGYDMVAPGCSIAPGSPLANLKAMVKAAEIAAKQ